MGGASRSFLCFLRYWLADLACPLSDVLFDTPTAAVTDPRSGNFSATDGLDPEQAVQVIRNSLVVKVRRFVLFWSSSFYSGVPRLVAVRPIFVFTLSYQLPLLTSQKFEGSDNVPVDEISQTVAVETDMASETSSEKSADLPKSSPHRMLHRMLSQSKTNILGNASSSGLDSSKRRQVRPDCKLCDIEFRGGDNVCESSNPRCSHMFHQNCINDWLQYQNTCPSCSETFVVLST